MLTDWWTIFLDMVYPPKCPGCKTVVCEQGGWCASCLGKIAAVRSINMVEHHLVSLDSCWAVCEYTGSLKGLIHDMKFRRKQGYARYLQWLLRKQIKGEMFNSIDYVIPVPLHEKRLQERGYNQTEAIFKDYFKGTLQDKFIAQENPWRPELLLRTRQTVPQWELKSVARKANITGAFVAPYPNIVKNKKILLVDDIFTTGMTLDECAKVLKNAGASSVHALVVASGAR